MHQSLRFLSLCAVVGLVACGGATPPPEPPKTTTPVQDDEIPIENDGENVAFLEISSSVPTKILLDGKAVGETPIDMLKVKPGTHEVTFVDERGGNRTMVVTVGPGESQSVHSNPSTTSADAILPPAPEGKK